MAMNDEYKGLSTFDLNKVNFNHVQKALNKKISEWQMAINKVKNGDRSNFVDLVKSGSGDYIYAKECTDSQALEQINMEIDFLKTLKEKAENGSTH